MMDIEKIEDELSLNKLNAIAPWFVLKDPKEEPPKDLQFVIDGYCAKGLVTVIGGKAGSGKSLLNQYLLSVRNNELLKTYPGGAVYLAGADSDAATLNRRAHKFANEGMTYLELPEETLCLASNEEFMRELGDGCKAKGVDAIIFDTMADFHEGNTNEAERANLTMSGFRRLARYANVAVIIITHTTKGSNSKLKYELDDIADSRIFVTKADFVFGLQSEDLEDGKLIELQCVKSREMKPISAIRAFISNNTRDEIKIEPTETLFKHEFEEFTAKEQRQELTQKVSSLKKEGASYKQIGNTLGISKTHAHRLHNN